MLSPRWRKVLQDLWFNKTRTVLVVLSIAVGVFGVGTIASTQVILRRDLRADYLAINPQSAIVWAEPFGEELVLAVGRMKEVAEAEGRRSVLVRVQVGPEKWKDLQLTAIPDFRNMRVNKVFPETGAWPPGKGEVLLERKSLRALGLRVGDRVTVELPGGKQKTLRIAGTVHDVNLPPVEFTPFTYGYISMATLDLFGLPREFDHILFTVAEHPDDMEHIRRVAEAVKDKIRDAGRSTGGTWLPRPGVHPADDAVQPLFVVMNILGFFTLLLSGFLVVNTISAVLTEQVRQIGMMKAVGARRSQLVGMYLALASAYGGLSLLVGVPLGALATRGLVDWLADLINFDVRSYAVPPEVLALQVTVGLGVPLLAALPPVLAGTRVTVREALSDYGVAAVHGRSWLDRWLERVRSLSRPLLLSLRNTFRRRARILRTLITLSLAGAIFIGVMSVRDSLLLTLEHAIQYFNYDISFHFRRPHRTDALQREALRVPGVERAESWTGARPSRVRPDGTVTKEYQLLALPPDSDFIRPQMIAGRWLLPDDGNAVVINNHVLKDEPDIQVGDEIVLKIEGKETTWRVVGIVRYAFPEALMYVNQSYFARVTDSLSRSSRVEVRLTDRSTPNQVRMARVLQEHFDRQGMKVGFTFTIGEQRERIETQFNLLVVFLLIMSVLLAVVGGLGLMGTMSINVLERTREIGVMRAIGASTGAIIQIVMVEGILIGLISWVIGTVAAVPISRLLSDGVGVAFMRSPLIYTFSVRGAVLWLGVVTVIAALASLMPAWRAARLSVREVLAYE